MNYMYSIVKGGTYSIVTESGQSKVSEEDDVKDDYSEEEEGLPAYSPSLGLYLTGGEHSDSWQDNWVFKQTTSVLTASMRNTVAMLGPNASDDVKAQIGNKDFDLVSELSELDEVASSDSDVSMNCFYKDHNKDTAEPENDNEYTIYEMVPGRKCSEKNEKNEKNEKCLESPDLARKCIRKIF